MSSRPVRRSALSIPVLAPVLVLVISLLVVVGWTASHWSSVLREQAAESSATAAHARRHRAIAAVVLPLQLERLLLERSVRVEHGDLGLVPGGAEIFREQLDHSVSVIQRDVDDALDALKIEFRANAAAADGLDISIVDTAIHETRNSLATLRGKVVNETATAADINDAYHGATQRLAEIAQVDTPVPTVDVGPDSERHTFALQAFANVLHSAGSYGEHITASQQHRLDSDPAEGIRLYTKHRTYLEMCIENISFDSDHLQTLLDDLSAIATALDTADEQDPTSGISDAHSQVEADYILYLDALTKYSKAFHDHTVEEATDRGHAAESEAFRWRLVFFAICLLSAGLCATLVFAVLRPLRALQERSDKLGSGELDQAPLPLKGSSEIRSLTSSLNAMTITLRRVGTELDELALTPNVTSPQIDLPGGFGTAVRTSLQRVSKMAADLRRSEQMSSAIVGHAADAIWTVCAQGVIKSANTASETLVGVPVNAQIGRSIDRLISCRDGEGVVVSSPYTRRVLVSSSTVDDPSPEGDTLTVVIAHDISERAEFERQLEYEAKHDPLTGLPNRLAVIDAIDTALSQPDAAVAVLFVDLDSFKAVNDSLGHTTGDHLLSDVSATLATTTRTFAPDAIVGRIGGDEFVVAIPDNNDLAWLKHVAEHAIADIEQTAQEHHRGIAISASVGVSVGEYGMAATDLIRQADNALHAAKRSGKGRVRVFDVDLRSMLERESEIEMALRQAVRSRSMHFHLQPIVDTKSGDVVAAEMLARWQHPELGHISPGEFIPMAERSSLIIDLQRQMLDQAGELLHRWANTYPGQPRRVAVNISGRHIVDGSLVDDIDAMVARWRVEPTQLEIELTESLLLDSSDGVSDTLRALRSRGVRISIDDLGTGYSSMTYLRSLPIDAIKIDRSFVARALDAGFDTQLISALVTIGHTLGLEVVAEGVETLAQRNLVGDLKCEYAQGYFVSRPSAPEVAEDIIFGQGSTPTEDSPG